MRSASIALFAALLLTCPLALPATSSHLGHRITSTLDPSLCLTYEPDLTYHDPSNLGTVNLVTCINTTNRRVPAQLWSTPAIGDFGPVRYLSSTGQMCLQARSNQEGSELTLARCDGSQRQDWEVKGTGEMVSAGTGLCVTVQDQELTDAIRRVKIDMRLCERGNESQSRSLTNVEVGGETQYHPLLTCQYSTCRQTPSTIHSDRCSAWTSCPFERLLR
jgi:hypothetical protein